MEIKKQISLEKTEKIITTLELLAPSLMIVLGYALTQNLDVCSRVGIGVIAAIPAAAATRPLIAGYLNFMAKIDNRKARVGIKPIFAPLNE